MGASSSIVVIGAGVFGLTAALELARRGHGVTVLEAGAAPNPLASSTDVSRMVRMDYGSDGLYTGLAVEAIKGWRDWNALWDEEVYHETGLLLASSLPLEPGTFEQDSLVQLESIGYQVQRMDSSLLRDRFPDWNADKFVDGYFNPVAGWAEALRVIGCLAQEAQHTGVSLRTGTRVARISQEGTRVTGVVTSDGVGIQADLVVLAAGAWTPLLLPRLSDFMGAVGQPVFYFEPEEPERFRGPGFPPWAADVSRTGWYGFPANRDGLVKVGNHGPGRLVHSDDPRDVTARQIGGCREFLREALPALAEQKLKESRLCWYCDTWDGNFWIDHDPDAVGLVVATGGSGHGFKFAPVMGSIVADVVERKPNKYADRFAWRDVGEPASEAIRFTGR